jgi:hypothetical protein
LLNGFAFGLEGPFENRGLFANLVEHL